MPENLENSKSAFWKKKERGNAFLQALMREEEPQKQEGNGFKTKLMLKRVSKTAKQMNY